MNIRILTTSTESSEKFWDGLADQLLDTQQPLSLSLAEQVFPTAGYNVQASVLNCAIERLCAAHRSIMKALNGLPEMKASLAQEAIA